MTKHFSIKGLVSGLFAATAALPAMAQDNLEIVGAPRNRPALPTTRRSKSHGL